MGEEYRYEFQSILMEIATKYINIDIENIEKSLIDTLGRLANFVGADRGYIFDYDWERNICSNTYEWCREGVSSEKDNLQNIDLNIIPSWVDTHKKGEMISIENLSLLTNNDEGDFVKDILEQQSVKSVLTIPIINKDKTIGFVGFDSVFNHKIYSEDDKKLLQLFAQMLATIQSRKILEERILALNSIIQNSSDIGVLKDINLKYIAVNKSYTALTGHTDKDVIGKTDRELFKNRATDEQIDEYIQNDLDALKLNQGEFIVKEEMYPDKIFLTKKFPVFNDFGEKIGVATIASDITERKNMENLISQQKNLLEAVVTSLPGYLNVVDSEYNIITLNNNRLKIGVNADKNRKKSDVIGKKCYEVFMNRSEKCSWCKIDKVIETGEAYIEQTTSDDPREKLEGKSYQIITSPIKNSDGKITGVVEYSIDITELKNAIKEAQDANRAKSEFLSNMSHEIRTPLNSVIGFTELLKETELTDIQREFVSNANISGKMLLDIISDILDFSKIEAGKLELEIIKTDIRKLIDDVLITIKNQINKKDLKIDLELSQKIPFYAYFDPIRLKQVLMNLLSNAVKFTEKGMIKLSIYFEEQNDNYGEFYFSVKDTGIGIAKENKDRLFRAFSQADTSTTRKYGGTGLGLIISNLLVKKMGGKIDFDSTEGVGSEFYFKIKTAYDKSINQNAFFKNIKTALFISSDKDSSLSFEKSFFISGVDFIKVDSGINSIVEISKIEKQIDLLIINYNMPYFNGVDTLKMISIKYRELYQNSIKIVLCDTINDESFVLKSDLEIDFVAQKSIKVDKLFYVIQSLEKKNQEKIDVNQNYLYNSFSNNNKLESLKPTILIAEDVEMNLKLIKIMVLKLIPDAKIFVADNGLDVINIVKLERIDFIFMDIQMPLLDGVEATKEIRRYQKNLKLERHIPIIALTASALESEKKRSLENGMDDFLTKPVQLDSIKSVFRKYIYGFSK
ncbi:response regulator [bacterium]|nr:response regulator [bacterium]